MQQPPLESQDIRLLMDIGMLGAGAGQPLHEPVERLFSALMRLRPDRDFAYIGQATAWMNQGRGVEAAEVLERGLRMVKSSTRAGSDQDADMLMAFRGLALFMARHSAEATGQLQELLRTGSNPQALRMARGLMGLPLDEPTPEGIQ
jgi:hypothetical protein